MPPILLRIIWAVLFVLLFWIILPPLCRILGLPLSGDIFTILRAIVAFGALFYIIWGTTFWIK